MVCIRDQLQDLVKNNEDFKKYHFKSVAYKSIKNFTPKQLRDDILGFLAATNDAVRLRRADDAAEKLLSLIDCQDLVFLRKAVLRRELGRDIDYEKQRDHAAHTLNNYLLGWYFVVTNRPIRETLKQAFSARLANTAGVLEQDVFFRYFGHTWQFVSLMHDIGYICEGSLPTLDTKVLNDRVARGAATIHQYFNHRFWFDVEGDSDEARQVGRVLTGRAVPNYRQSSVAGLGDVLCGVGKVDAAMAEAQLELIALGCEVQIVDLESNKSSDAFEMWARHYQFYGQKDMVHLIGLLKSAYKFMVYDGVGDKGVRMLDHGVVSGLLILQYVTLQAQLYGSLRRLIRNGPGLSAIEQKIWNLVGFIGVPGVRGKPSSNAEKMPENGFGAHLWWTCLVWASAASAVHNLLQLKRPWPGGERGTPAGLKMQSDPLAFLGVLVDCLQEWDRYDVIPESGFQGLQLPVQATEVRVAKRRGLPVQLTYLGIGDKRLKAMKENLTYALGQNWRKVVEVRR